MVGRASDELLTVSEIAGQLPVAQQTVGNWIERGELKAIRLGIRRVRVRQEDFDLFLQAAVPTAGTKGSQPPPTKVRVEADDQVERRLFGAADAFKD